MSQYPANTSHTPSASRALAVSLAPVAGLLILTGLLQMTALPLVLGAIGAAAVAVLAMHGQPQGHGPMIALH